MSHLTEETLVIRPKRSRKKRLSLMGLYALIFVASIGLMFYLGYQFGNGHGDESSQVIKSLRKEYKELKGQYDDLLANEAKLVQSESVQKSAYSELEKDYELVEQKNEFLNRRVNFYRSILSPEDGVSGVRIHDVSLREELNDVYFEIVLIQAINHERKATAKVYVELFNSKRDRKPITSWKAANHDFQFKFSEVVRGALNAKDGLDGKFLKIIVLPSGDSSKQLVEWHKV